MKTNTTMTKTTITKAKKLLQNLNTALEALAELHVDDGDDDGSEPESEYSDDSSDDDESDNTSDGDGSNDGSSDGSNDGSDDDWNDTVSVHDSDDESANYASDSDSSSAGDLSAATRSRTGRTFFRNETYVPGSGWYKRPGYDGTDHGF